MTSKRSTSATVRLETFAPRGHEVFSLDGPQIPNHRAIAEGAARSIM